MRSALILRFRDFCAGIWWKTPLSVETPIDTYVSGNSEHPKGVSKQNRNRKSKIETIINKALIGLCSKHVPLRFLGSEKMND